MNKPKRTTDIVNIDTTKKDLTIIHISDIHFNINTKTKRLNKLIEEIKLNCPDYIMISGDLIDNPKITENKEKTKELVVFLTNLAKIAKVIISIGNHDVLKEGDYKFFKKLNDLKDIYILDNDYYKDEFIYVSGFTLPNNYYYNMTHRESKEILLEYLSKQRKLIYNFPKDIPKVSLIHSPIHLTNNEITNLLKNYDLILTGHTHNGMVPDAFTKYFKNTGLIDPRKKFFPKIAKGKIEKKIDNHKLTIIINGGITKLSLHSAKALSKLNFVYNMSVNKIIITKKRGKI